MGTLEKQAASQQYRSQLLDLGVSKQDVSRQNVGRFIDPQEFQRIKSGFQGAQIQQGFQNLASQQYQFDPQKFLPQIQQQAASIYDPQQQQLQALAELQQRQAEQAKVTTREDFARLMERETEEINRRGAFFGGGAIEAGQRLGVEEARQLRDIELQSQAEQAGFLAQQAGLSAAQAQYVQQRLTESESSAYARFVDNRNFMMSLNQEQRRIFESDRQFAEDVRQFGLNYALDERRVELSEKEYEDAKIPSQPNYQHYEVGGKMFTFDPATGQSIQTGSYPYKTGSTSTGTWTTKYHPQTGKPMYQTNSKTGEIREL